MKHLTVPKSGGPPALDSNCSDGQCVFGVLASTDDAGPKPECGFETYWPEIYFGRCFSGSYITSGFRFPNVTVAQGAQITRAYLVFTVDGLYTLPVKVNVYGEASGNAQPYSATSQPKDRLRVNGLSATWPLGTNNVWNSGESKQSPDITSIVQAIVNRSDWQSGNALALVTETANTGLALGSHRRVFAFDRAGVSFSARLVIQTGTSSSGRVPVIFIPGIGGTELRDSSGTVWLSGEIILSQDDSFMDKTQLDTVGNPLDASVRATSVLTTALSGFNVGANDVYQTFLDYLTSNSRISNDFPGLDPYVLGHVGNSSADPSIYNHVVNYSAGQNLWFFPVDFRRDLTTQADSLDVLVNDVLTNTGASQVNLVGHSQGGLIIREYIGNPAHSERAGKVNKVITLGTPYLGASQSFQALRYGSDFGIPLGLLNRSEIKKIVQNWPGAYQLLPVNDSFFSLAGGYFSSSRDLDQDGQVEGIVRTRAEMDALLKNPGIVDDAAPPFLSSGYNAAMVGIAENFQSDGIAGWQASNVERTVIAGTGVCTPKLYYEYMGWGYFPQIGLVPVPKVRVTPDNGDGTVLKVSADMGQGSLNSVSGGATIYYLNGARKVIAGVGALPEIGHQALPNNQARAVAAFLNDQDANLAATPTYGRLSTTPTTTAGCTTITVLSPVDIHLADAAGNHTGLATNGVDIEQGISGSQFFRFANNQVAMVSSGATYTITLAGTGPGTFDLIIEDWLDDASTRTVVYQGVPVSPNTRARLIYDAANQPGSLELDFDGNGVYEQAIAPSSVVGAQGNDSDLQAPSTSMAMNGAIGANGWFTSSVTVTLSASDNTNGVGMLKTVYTLDNGQTVQSYTSPFVITQDGTWTVQAYSIDRAGNSEAPLVSATIRIDKTAPSLNVSVSPNNLWPPNHRMVTVTPTVQASDNLDPAPVVQLVSVTCADQSGCDSSDIVVQVNGTIQLRAERAGNGNGRVYTLTYSAQDAAGNATTRTATVTVPHNQ